MKLRRDKVMDLVLSLGAMLFAVLFALLLFGCGAPPQTLVQRQVEYQQCEVPAVECPAFPVLPADVSIEQLEDALIDGRLAHAECAAAFDAVVEACGPK